MTHKGIPDYQRAARCVLKDYVNVRSRCAIFLLCCSTEYCHSLQLYVLVTVRTTVMHDELEMAAKCGTLHVGSFIIFISFVIIITTRPTCLTDYDSKTKTYGSVTHQFIDIYTVIVRIPYHVIHLW